MQLTQMAFSVLKARYLREDESPESLFYRVADYVSQNEQEKQKFRDLFFDLMYNGIFLPNSPTLMNAGNKPGYNQLAACFVLPIEDDMSSIFETLKKCALIHKSGGGVGINYSNLRPKNSIVHSTRGLASGPVSFMKVFDAGIEQVKQGGKRRGANIGLLRANHPDILEFIQSKTDGKSLSNFNISVVVTDEIMNSMIQSREIELIDHQNKVVGYINGSKLLDEIAYNAWLTGDPGLIFIDAINRYNPTPHIGKIECVNPCGEQPLLPNEACILGSINLSKFVVNDQIDIDKLKDTVDLCVRFLDNSIDVCDFPLPEIEQSVKRTRKIGLGVMGFADVLAMLKIPYDSKHAVQIAEKLQSTINSQAISSSMKLGEERGIPQDIAHMKRRNACVTTIAPTGTISIIADCSSGIEPYFALAYERIVLGNEKYEYINPYLLKEIEKLKLSKSVYNEILYTGKVSHIKDIPDEIKRVFKTAHDIHYTDHIAIQAAFQKHTENAVSKTINMQHNASVDDVKESYKLAYSLGLKGITIFRDGCKDKQVLQTKEARERTTIKKDRPSELHGTTYKINTGFGNMYITVNTLNNRAFEVFTIIGKAGTAVAAKTEAISRLISLALRSGVSIKEIVNQLKGIGGGNPVFDNGATILSIPDAIAHVLSKYSEETAECYNSNDLCPGCGNMLTQIEGCNTCYTCGFSTCG